MTNAQQLAPLWSDVIPAHGWVVTTAIKEFPYLSIDGSKLCLGPRVFGSPSAARDAAKKQPSLHPEVRTWPGLNLVYPENEGGEPDMSEVTRLSDPVIYVDPFGIRRGAVLSTIWDGGPNPVKDSKGRVIVSDAPAPCVNLVFTSGDDARTDNGGCGRQIERGSSIVHASVQTAHGNYWRRLTDPAKDTERDA